MKKEKKMLGFAKRDLEKDEIMELPLNKDGKILPNEHINFIEGTNIIELKGGRASE